MTIIKRLAEMERRLLEIRSWVHRDHLSDLRVVRFTEVYLTDLDTFLAQSTAPGDLTTKVDFDELITRMNNRGDDDMKNDDWLDGCETMIETVREYAKEIARPSDAGTAGWTGWNGRGTTLDNYRAGRWIRANAEACVRELVEIVDVALADLRRVEVERDLAVKSLTDLGFNPEHYSEAMRVERDAAVARAEKESREGGGWAKVVMEIRMALFDSLLGGGCVVEMAKAMRKRAEQAEAERDLAFAEIRKQVFASKVVFDRYIVEKAQASTTAGR